MNSNNIFWAANIKFLRNRLRLSQDEMSQRLAISRSKLNAHENGQTQNPPLEDLVNFSQFFRISIDNLIKVDLAKLSDTQLSELEAGNDSYAAGTKLRVLATTVTPDNREQIEFVSQKARAGYLTGFGDPEYIASLPTFSMPHLPQDRKFRMFPTTGDSMYPIPEHSLIIGNFVEDWMRIKEKTPCIVITREDGIVFKLVTSRISQNRTLLLESLNPAYPPYEVNVSDVLEVWQFVNYISDTLPEAEMPLEIMAKTLQEIKDDLRKLATKK